MGATFTEGEWFPCSAANGSSVTVRGPNHARIATLKSDHPTTKGRKMANARLVAASPRLLAVALKALDLVERDVIRVRPSDREELLAWLEDLNGSIAKAQQ